MAKHPRDRFDDVPRDLHRVGAHRAAPRPGRIWFVIGVWAVVAVVLTLVGILGLARLGYSGIDLSNLGGADDSSEVDPGVEAPEPMTDPTQLPEGVTVAVLNGTDTGGLANRVGDELTETGWPVDSRASTSATDVQTTTVYFVDPEQQAAALGLVQILGVGEVEQSDAFPSALTIVLGADYAAAEG